MSFSPGHFHQHFNTSARAAVYLLQSQIGQYPVLAGNVHNIAGNADGYQVEVAVYILKGKAVFFGISLDQFKTNTTARKLFKRVFTIRPFRIKYGYRSGQFVTGQMMIANNKINAFGIGISNFVN